MKAPDGWYSFRTLLKVSIKSELPSKEGRELPFWRNFEDKALSPHVLLSISACFVRRLVLQLNSCKPWWVNFDWRPMRLTSGRNVRVPVLARPLHNVLEKDTLPSQCISLTRITWSWEMICDMLRCQNPIWKSCSTYIHSHAVHWHWRQLRESSQFLFF